MKPISQAFRCFEEVVRRGSVRKAAVSLHLTPAAVNQQILNLEADVGTPLFDRLPRGMRLTAAGEILIVVVRRTQRDLENAVAQIEWVRSLRRGHIKLGVSHSSAEQLIPLVLESSIERYPGITYNIRCGTGEALLRWLAAGEIDIAYCLKRTPPPGVSEVRTWPQQIGVVAPAGHELHALGRAPRLRDCVSYPLILMAQDTELRLMLGDIDMRSNREVRPFIETDSVAMAMKLIERKRGIGFFLAENAAEQVREGRLRWTGLGDSAARGWGCLYQRAGHSTPVAMGMFLEFLEHAIAATTAEQHE